jgi:hypothetical protein
MLEAGAFFDVARALGHGGPDLMPFRFSMASLAAALRSLLRELSSLPPLLGKTAVALSILLLVLLWSNSRILILRMNQDPANPIVLSGYYVYHGMAAGLEEGKVGQLDLTRYREYTALNNPYAAYRPRSRHGPAEFVNYYTMDIGYSFIVELARLLFPTIPDNYWRAIALQLVADAATVVLVFLLFSEWRGGLGLAAAFLYVANKVFIQLVSFAYYYYWDVPITFVVLGLLLLAHRRPAQASGWLAIAGAVLGFGVWLRASWWAISLFYFATILTSRSLRRKAWLAMLFFALIAAPQVWRSSRARGHLTLSTRATWHVALVALGYYPNAYGLQANDESVFRLILEKYGVAFQMENYSGPHDEAAKKEFLSILRRDPRFVIGSFLGRLEESLLGTTKESMPPFPFVSNPVYRALCVAGLLLMLRTGGDRGLLGGTAAGIYLIYVVLTSFFYFVGLAYDNVSQVALFVLFMGLLDWTAKAVGERALRPRLSCSPDKRQRHDALDVSPPPKQLL